MLQPDRPWQDHAQGQHATDREDGGARSIREHGTRLGATQEVRQQGQTGRLSLERNHKSEVTVPLEV